jgi:Flp pilus assembly protein TadD
MAQKNFKQAVEEFTQANQQDPRVIFLTAQAYPAAGDLAQARALAKKAADFNGLNPTYAFVRAKAKKLAQAS